MIKKAARLALKGMDKEGRKRVADAIGISPITLYTWIKSNSDNLTKAKSIAAISKETGLPASEILEEEVSEPQI